MGPKLYITASLQECNEYTEALIQWSFLDFWGGLSYSSAQ